MKRFLASLLLICILCSLAACAEPSGDENTTTTTPAVTTSGSDTSVSDSGTQKPTPVTALKLRFSELGLTVSRTDLSDADKTIITAITNLITSMLIITPQSPGTVTFRVYNAFGHSAKLTVTVDEDLVATAKVDTKPTIIDAGAYRYDGTTKRSDLKTIQAAIDAAHAKYKTNGTRQTVYVSPGRYAISGNLQMKQGVTLKLYTEMTDAKVGYTSDIKAAVDGYKYAVFVVSQPILNVPYNAYATSCDTRSDFTIDGGVLDMQGAVVASLIIGAADNVKIQNVIFKDICGQHAIQITGCTNTSVTNCMFAGYKLGANFTREVVQVEPTTTGANGSDSSTTPIQYSSSLNKNSQNITIEGCYFGKSDEQNGPIMAIGHHSYNSSAGANVHTMYIKNNVFDECLYAAIRFNSLDTVEISGNTFIASEASNWRLVDKSNMNGLPTYQTPSMIEFYRYGSGDYGIERATIKNNTFTFSGAVDRRVLYYSSSTGYYETMTVQNNNITYTGAAATYSNYYIYLNGVYSVNYTKGTVSTGNNSFSSGVYY